MYSIARKFETQPECATHRDHTTLSFATMPRTKATSIKNQNGPRVTTATPGDKPKKKRRMKRVKGAIVKLQRSTNNLVSAASMERVIREVLQKCGGGTMRITPRAIRALHQAAEPALIQVLQDADRIGRVNGGRAGPMACDFHSAVVIGSPDLMSKA